jgi:predicted transposase/invertase (TIGR01784 family)
MEGEQTGMQKGEQIGLQKGKAEVAHNMRAAGMAMGEIAKLTSLSLREVQQICQ